ncbi:MAG: spermidine synthase [Acidobacteriota bacterium]
MIPWTLLDRAPLPDSSDEIRLYQRGAEYAIRVANYELMNSRVHGSEEALAELAFAKLAGRSRMRVLVGGLGIGYTLAAALRGLDAGGEAVVAELVPAVVKWNRGPLAALAGHPLDDPRVLVLEKDVARVIRENRGGFDAILLDVDTGPRALTHEDNRRLYDAAGLRVAYAALRPRGVLAIWSGGRDPAFTRRLSEAGFTVEEVRARARGEGGRAHYIVWVAQRP